IGDKVLIQVANVVKNNIRNLDCAARVGGEEFVIFLPNIRGKAAFATAERVRKAIENQIFLDSNNNAFQVTASIGLTRSEITNDVFSALQSADEAVYEAKQSGKNCVKIASNIEFSFSPNITFTDNSELSLFLN
ncbi:MAG TPA: GGDEF domain-containing protein, partial [Pyrinomonadaceae bacterium]|nr:GGDEF domain-containing protein [Pyrinomonadaceae bacterium]